VRFVAHIFRVVASAKRTISAATRDALRSRSRRRPRPRFLAGGVLEYWSIGVLRLLRIAPAAGWRCFQGDFSRAVTQG
jgi:hypothetical protein